ncbi:MAG: DUF4872 domain-containing protein [Planctomycetota bacterium]
MTRSKRLKNDVRARMQKTGERYTTARAHILAKLGLIEPSAGGYDYRPGICPDTGAVRNFAEACGLHLPNGKAPSEALITGLAGGVGFLYIVFEYGGMPPMISVLTRFDTAADRFAVGALERLGLGLQSSQTASAAKARKDLDAALDRGRPVLCIVDAPTLKSGLTPKELRGMAPTLVTVVSREGERYQVDTGRGAAFEVDAAHLAEARAANKKCKHGAWVPAGTADSPDWSAAIQGAVAACAGRYTEAPYKGFASNFGLAGLEKWARLLVDRKDKKGWPTLFPEGRLASLALRRTWQGLEVEMTPPAAGRGLYAQFLREAAHLTRTPAYETAALAFDRSANAWNALSECIASSGVPAVASGCELLDAYAESLDEAASGTRDWPAELSGAAEGPGLDRDGALALYASMAEHVAVVLDTERTALAALESALPGRG